MRSLHQTADATQLCLPRTHIAGRIDRDLLSPLQLCMLLKESGFQDGFHRCQLMLDPPDANFFLGLGLVSR